MLRSIRLRLVVATVFLTLLTVSAVGVVALLLMQRYMVQQEQAYLTANAEAIAGQAAQFMSTTQVVMPLQQLADTAAFLSDADVRIVDQAQVALADSAQAWPGVEDTQSLIEGMLFSVAPSTAGYVTIAPAQQVWRIVNDGGSPYAMAQVITTTEVLAVEAMAGTPVSAGDANVLIVERSPSFWGDRLTFGTTSIPAEVRMGLAADPVAAPSAGYSQSPAVDGVAIDGVVNASDSLTLRMAAPPVVHMQVMSTTGAIVLPGNEAAMVEAMGDQNSSFASTTLPSTTLPTTLASPTFVNTFANTVEPRRFWQTVGLQSADVVSVPILSDNAVLGFVELGRSADLVTEPLGAIRRALMIAAAASGLLAIGVGLVMSRTLIAPIQNLAQAAASMSSGDLTARAPVVGQDELASLARQFNQMADALHLSFAELAAERDTLRRFVADASHELRTPITALRTFNELLQGPARGDSSAEAEFLSESQVQITRLEWITRNLLDLSRWDSGVAQLSPVEADVGEVVMSAAMPLRALAQDRQIELLMTMPDVPLVACVDAQRLEIAVGNLLDNALKFTPDGGRVEVGVCAVADGVKIWVADTGMGIDEAELPHIFERFYRSPRAVQAGSGLGLAIVAHIVRAHGATIDVTSHCGAGSCFTLCLPVA